MSEFCGNAKKLMPERLLLSLKPDGNGCDIIVAFKPGKGQAMGIFFFLAADHLFESFQAQVQVGLDKIGEILVWLGFRLGDGEAVGKDQEMGYPVQGFLTLIQECFRSFFSVKHPVGDVHV